MPAKTSTVDVYELLSRWINGHPLKLIADDGRTQVHGDTVYHGKVVLARRIANHKGTVAYLVNCGPKIASLEDLVRRVRASIPENAAMFVVDFEPSAGADKNLKKFRARIREAFDDREPVENIRGMLERADRYAKWLGYNGHYPDLHRMLQERTCLGPGLKDAGSAVEPDAPKATIADRHMHRRGRAGVSPAARPQEIAVMESDLYLNQLYEGFSADVFEHPKKKSRDEGWADLVPQCWEERDEEAYD